MLNPRGLHSVMTLGWWHIYFVIHLFNQPWGQTDLVILTISNYIQLGYLTRNHYLFFPLRWLIQIRRRKYTFMILVCGLKNRHFIMLSNRPFVIKKKLAIFRASRSLLPKGQTTVTWKVFLRIANNLYFNWLWISLRQCGILKRAWTWKSNRPSINSCLHHLVAAGLSLGKHLASPNLCI